MTSISLQQDRSVIDGSPTLYRVANLITATSGGPPLALFVNKVDVDEYSHVASVTDIMNYPESRNEALNLKLDYYRRPDATKDWAMLNDALHFMSVVREQLAYLVQAYNSLETEFVGTDTYVFGDA